MNNTLNETLIDKTTLNSIQEHAKGYEVTSDKKQFLKEVSAYEQKLILLTSSYPCDVLRFLADINSKSANLVLQELNDNDILNILNKFTADDRRWFYNHFSNIDVVNKFIKYDNDSLPHVKNLPLERKVELIANSDSETQAARKEVYSSMTTEEIKEVTTNNSIPTKVVNTINDFESSTSNSIVDDNVNIPSIEPLVEVVEEIDNKIEEENEQDKPNEEPEKIEKPIEEQNKEIPEENKDTPEINNTNDIETEEEVLETRENDKTSQAEALEEFKQISSEAEQKDIETFIQHVANKEENMGMHR